MDILGEQAVLVRVKGAEKPSQRKCDVHYLKSMEMICKNKLNIQIRDYF